MPKESKEGAQKKAYNKLFNEIIRGVYSPGEKISIRSVSAEMGTSITPVREALLKLEAQGAVSVSSTGVMSIPIRSIEEIEQLYSVRMLVEGQLAAEAAERISDVALKELRLLENKAQELQGTELGESVFLNEEFHMTVYREASNPVAMGIINHLWLQCGPLLPKVYAFHKVISETLSYKFPSETDHLRLIDCLAEKNPEGARQALVDDIQSGLNVYRAIAIDLEKAISEVSKSITN